MKRHWQALTLVSVIGLVVLLGSASRISAQTTEPHFFGSQSPEGLAKGGLTKAPHPPGVLSCRGPLRLVADVGFEGLLFTPNNFFVPAGGGEGGCFDPAPVLSTTVTLSANTCLNAHFSAIVGSRQTYGPALAPLALFQVTVTPTGGVPQHLVGHYETPYGVFCPAVAIEAERDVDTFGSNFFQRVGTQAGDIPPGVYRVDVWWAGAPLVDGVIPEGVLGAAFVLKLYYGG